MKQLIYILLTSFLTFYAKADCHQYEGDWWLANGNDNFWVKETYSFSQNCNVISIQRTTFFYGDSDVELSTYHVTSGWVFKDRWKADKDQEWYSQYGSITWQEDTLVVKTHLYRERDNQLAWDFTTWKNFSLDLLTRDVFQFFPIENHTYKFHEDWVRQKP